MENTDTKTNQHEEQLIRFTLPLLNLPPRNIERRRESLHGKQIANWQRKAVRAPAMKEES